MPSDLPEDAKNALSRRCEKQGVRELAVPLGDGWMQRAGRGNFSVLTGSGDDGESGGSSSKVMEVESLEPNFYLLTYDQTPDAHVTKSGYFRLEVTLRFMPGHTVRETPYVSIALNWQRSKSSITSPCFTSVALTPNAWRIEQYSGEGTQSSLCEVRDANLKAGGAFQKVVIEVRGDRLALKVNKRPVVDQILPPPPNTHGAPPGRTAAALTGSVGVAVYKSRMQLKKFELSALDDEDGVGGGGGGQDGNNSNALVPTRPQFTNGDPKLIEVIEGEMLDASPQVSWESIGGLTEAKRLLNEAVVLPLLIPEYFAAASCRSTWKGVLLFGPPGTGKTLLARAVASLNKTAFFNISASSLVSKYHGESEKLARTLFAMARHHAPSVVFFDEIDALVSTRGMQGEHEASRRLKSELLVQMDGVTSGGGEGGSGQVMVLATSNKPWDLDEALRRRLERRIYVPLPDEASRHEMLNIHLNGVKLADGVDTMELARRSEGYSGADLQLACRDASMMPMRRMVEGKSPMEIVELQQQGALEGEVSMDDFTNALSRTSPSTNAAEQTQYEKWDEEYGCK